MSYVSKLMKFKFIDTNDDFTMDFTNTSMKLFNLLGFKERKIYSSTANELYSDKIINIHGPPMINAYIDKLNCTDYAHSRNDIQLNSFKIPITCNRGGIIEYRNIHLNENFITMKTQGLNSFRIKLLDEIIPFDINGSDIFLLLFYK